MSGSSTVAGFIRPLATSTPEGNALEDIFQALIVGLTGLPATLVRPAYQDDPPAQPPPSTNWAAFMFQMDSGQDYQFHEQLGAAADGQGEARRGALVQVEALISFRGPAAISNARLFRTGAMVPQNQEALRAQQIAIEHIDEARLVPTLDNTQWVKRVDVQVRIQQAIIRTYAIRNLVEAPTTITGAA